MVAVLASTSHIYTGLDVNTQRSLRESAHRLGELAQDAAVNLWEMGKILTKAQACFAHNGTGSFQRWVTEEGGLSLRTAYRLINVHKAFDRGTVARTNCAISALYVLSESSTPAAARREAIKRARDGESITKAVARQIVQAHTPPPLPALPPLPAKPPSPEYKRFEREVLRPQLHDAGIEDAPQMLSGAQAPLQAATENQKERARESLHQAVFDVIKTVDVEDDEDIGRCASEVLALLGQNNNIAIAAHFGRELGTGAKTLSDLVSVAACVCGEYVPTMERDDYLRLRKRVLRIVDALSLGGVGLPVYEHKLANGQIAYSLLSPDCYEGEPS